MYPTLVLPFRDSLYRRRLRRRRLLDLLLVALQLLVHLFDQLLERACLRADVDGATMADDVYLHRINLDLLPSGLGLEGGRPPRAECPWRPGGLQGCSLPRWPHRRPWPAAS